MTKTAIIFPNREVHKTKKGFRLFQTTDVPGQPFSPFFPTLHELCDWAETNATVFGDITASSVEWMALLTKKRG